MFLKSQTNPSCIPSPQSAHELWTCLTSQSQTPRSSEESIYKSYYQDLKSSFLPVSFPVSLTKRREIKFVTDLRSRHGTRNLMLVCINKNRCIVWCIPVYLNPWNENIGNIYIYNFAWCLKDTFVCVPHPSPCKGNSLPLRFPFCPCYQLRIQTLLPFESKFSMKKFSAIVIFFRILLTNKVIMRYGFIYMFFF